MVLELKSARIGPGPHTESEFVSCELDAAYITSWLRFTRKKMSWAGHVKCITNGRVIG